MRLELKSIGYWSLIKISFVLNLVIGFIIGLFYALFMGLFWGLMGEMSSFGGMAFDQYDAPPIGLMLIIMPLFFSFFGAVINTILLLICTLVYNLTAKLIGGLEFDFAEMQPKADTYAAPPPTGAYTTPPIQEPPPRPRPQTPPPPPPLEPLPPDVQPPEDNSGRDKEEL